MNHIKIPKDRIGVLIGSKGEMKKLIEEIGRCQLDIDSKEGTVEIHPEDPLLGFRVREVVQAIGRGFSPEKALKLLEDEMLILEIIDLTRSIPEKRLEHMRGRIIGKNGRTRQIFESLLGINMSVYGKTVALLGHPEQITAARTALEMLLSGANHGPVYSFLERKHRELQTSRDLTY